MLTAEHVQRASDVFNAELARMRAGRVTMSELCASLLTHPKTVRQHMGAGLITGERVICAGKPVWLFEPTAVESYKTKRAIHMANSLIKGQRSTGGRKLASAPDGYTTLIDVAALTGHSMDFMREAARRSGLTLHRGPKRVLMVETADAERLRSFATQFPPRPSRQKEDKRGQPIMWTAEMDAALGTESDTLLAGLWGISPAAVSHRRVELGVSALNPATDAFQWREEHSAWFAKRPDHVLAEMFGASVAQVRRRRKALGIPAFTSGRLWTREAFDLLGKVPDVEISQMIGARPITVGQMRARLGIPRFLKSERISTMKKTETLSQALLQKIEQARPAMLERLKQAGFGFTEVTDEQVLSAALDLLIQQQQQKHPPQ